VGQVRLVNNKTGLMTAASSISGGIYVHVFSVLKICEKELKVHKGRESVLKIHKV